MISHDLPIINKLGLHARAAARFVNLANQFESEISVSRNGRTVNGKSIMGLMVLAASMRSAITVAIDGKDESAAMQAITTLIKDRFEEDL